jgi:hypothetical protein
VSARNTECVVILSCEAIAVLARIGRLCVSARHFAARNHRVRRPLPDENSIAAVRRCLGADTLTRERKLEDEDRSLPHRAPDAKVAAHRARKIAADGQT